MVMRHNDKDINGAKNGATERDNHLIQIKTSKRIFERLKERALHEGFTTLSSYIRFKCLNPSLDEKLNQILHKQDVILTRSGAKNE